MTDVRKMLDARCAEIHRLSGSNQGSAEWFEAASLALSLLHDTVGAHPLAPTVKGALDKGDPYHAAAGARAIAKLYESGGLDSPRLAIAHEIEGDLLQIAQQQTQRAENATVQTKRVHLGIAAFLAGAALEDCLRRLCDANGLAYEAQNTSLARLQSVLYQPNNGVAVISSSENKQITSWGATRNTADHGKLADLTQAEVLSMVIGVRGFVDKHMP